MTLGTRIVVMKDGVIQQVDTPQNLFQYPCNKFVAGFIGTPVMNFVDGIVKKEEEIYVDTKYGKVTLTKEKQDKLVDYVDKKVIVGVRPEHIKITDSGIKGKLNVYEMLGSEAICYIQVDDEL